MKTPLTARRVAITGIGAVSAIGVGIARFRDSLRACRSGIETFAPRGEAWPEVTSYLAAPVKDIGESEDPLALDRFTQLALVAAREAIRDAGEEMIRERSARTAVVVGSAAGGERSHDAASHRVFARRSAPHPMTILRTMMGQVSSAVSMAHGITGPAFTMTSACASSAHAIGHAFRMLQFGMADVAVTGGAEALPSFAAYRAWQLMRVLSPDGCRPFAADRNGIVLGEGAGILVLEALDNARARGARIYAEVVGFGMSSDAKSWVVPDAEGMVRCMRDALDDAGIDPSAVAYVNAHATGTPRGDAAEAVALACVFEGDAARVPVSSTKALHGHALGASAALEAIAAVLGLGEEWIPPMPATSRDPDIALNLAAAEVEPLRGEFALSNSFGFGGANAALVLRRI